PLPSFVRRSFVQSGGMPTESGSTTPNSKSYSSSIQSGGKPRHRGVSPGVLGGLGTFRKATVVVKRTPYPKALTAALNDYDQYREATESMFGCLLNLIQPNGMYRGVTGTSLILKPPEGQEPHEALYAALAAKPMVLNNQPKLQEDLDKSSATVAMLAEEKNAFFRSAESKMAHLSFFVYKFTVDFEEARAVMEKSRDSVDSASNALKRAGKNAVSAAESALNLAAAEYKKAVDAVLSLLTTLPELKKNHYTEIEDVVTMLVDHNTNMKKCLAEIRMPAPMGEKSKTPITG
ncbi:hypothetical protein PENTCL1PPCAC_1790, partial [Pristionchus entomophagus]